MFDFRPIIANIRKIITTAIWVVVGLFLIALDQTAITIIGKLLGNSLDTLGINNVDKLVSMMFVPGGTVVQAVNALRVTAVIYRLVSLMIVVVPMFALLFVVMPVAGTLLCSRNYGTQDEGIVLVHQGVYILQDKFRC